MVRRQGGYSIVELIIAMFLLALGITLIAYLVPIATRGQARSRVVTAALFWAQERIEDAQIHPDAPAVLPDPQDGALLGEIRRQPWTDDTRFTHLQVVVYRADDTSKRPLVELEMIMP